MKKNKIISILDSVDIKKYVEQNLTAYKIVQLLSPKLGENNTPSETAIRSYIKNRFNLQWDSKTKTWIYYQKDKDSSIKNTKKRNSKVDKNITISHESEIIDDETLQEYKKENLNGESFRDLHKQKISFNESILTESPSITKNEDKNITICSTNINTNGKQSINPNENKVNFNIPLKGLKDENINPSQYAEYITALGTDKYSLSISCFIIELIEQRISKKYNLDRKGNRSKIIQLALLEYLRITK